MCVWTGNYTKILYIIKLTIKESIYRLGICKQSIVIREMGQHHCYILLHHISSPSGVIPYTTTNIAPPCYRFPMRRSSLTAKKGLALQCWSYIYIYIYLCPSLRYTCMYVYIALCTWVSLMKIGHFMYIRCWCRRHNYSVALTYLWWTFLIFMLNATVDAVVGVMNMGNTVSRVGQCATIAPHRLPWCPHYPHTYLSMQLLTSMQTTTLVPLEL